MSYEKSAARAWQAANRDLRYVEALHDVRSGRAAAARRDPRDDAQREAVATLALMAFAHPAADDVTRGGRFASYEPRVWCYDREIRIDSPNPQNLSYALTRAGTFRCRGERRMDRRMLFEHVPSGAIVSGPPRLAKFLASRGLGVYDETPLTARETRLANYVRDTSLPALALLSSLVTRLAQPEHELFDPPSPRRSRTLCRFPALGGRGARWGLSTWGNPDAPASVAAAMTDQEQGLPCCTSRLVTAAIPGADSAVRLEQGGTTLTVVAYPGPAELSDEEQKLAFAQVPADERTAQHRYRERARGRV